MITIAAYVPDFDFISKTSPRSFYKIVQGSIVVIVFINFNF